MNYFFIPACLLLCAALVGYIFQRRSAWRHAKAPWPLYAKRPRSNPHQVLHQRLVAALPGHTVMACVPLVSVLGIRPGFDQTAWTRRLHGLQYDFVVCARDVHVLAAIALEDVPDSGAAQTRRLTVERASAAAGIRLLHWQSRALPDPAEIQATLGVPLTQFFEDVPASANQSWWPALTQAERDASQP